MNKHIRQRQSVGRAGLASLLVVALYAGAASSAAAEGSGTIATPQGPLSTITTSADLNCDVRYEGDSSPEFYGSIACATMVSVGGVLYGPAEIPAGGNANPRQPYTKISQSGPVGVGSAQNPFTVITEVALGDTGIRLKQTDTYEKGRQYYRTDVEVINTGSAHHNVRVYRAGDCYMGDSDFGSGSLGGNSVSCVSPKTGRVGSWIPLTPNAAKMEATYSEVWAKIGQQQPFSNTARDDNHDNAAGLSWDLAVAAGGKSQVSHLTAFAPDLTGDPLGDDRDGDALPDVWETNGIDSDGDGQIDVDLKAMGANPDVPDVFVQLDWMASTCVPAKSWFDAPNACAQYDYKPNPETLRKVYELYNRAPSNKAAVPINVHIDAGPDSVMDFPTGRTWGALSRAGQTPWVEEFGKAIDRDRYNYSDLNDRQNARVERGRRDVFHYGLIAHSIAGFPNFSGLARPSVSAGLQAPNERAGDAFMIARSNTSETHLASDIAHELGHNLGLHHGGHESKNYKPNYRSLMNYLYGYADKNNQQFSDGNAPDLDEARLDERRGLSAPIEPMIRRTAWRCPASILLFGKPSVTQASAWNGPANWNCSSSLFTDGIDSGTIAHNLTFSEVDTTLDMLRDVNDRDRMVFTGGAIGAFKASDPTDQDPPISSGRVDESPVTELAQTGIYGSGPAAILDYQYPGVLFKGVGGQSVAIEVMNQSSTEQAYVVKTEGIPGVQREFTTPPIPSGALYVARLAVDPAGLTVGTAPLRHSIHAINGGPALDQAVVQMTVPDLTNPELRASLQQHVAGATTPPAGANVEAFDALRRAAQLALGQPGGGTTGGAAPDPQSIAVDIPGGPLTISTPYTPNSPLQLGTATLSSDTKTFSAAAAFKDIKITDLRSVSVPWQASVQRADFVNATDPAVKISAEHSGLVNLVQVSTPHAALALTDAPPGGDALTPRTIAKVTGQGARGTTHLEGDFVLQGVPSSTPAGSYTAVVTFTVA